MEDSYTSCNSIVDEIRRLMNDLINVYGYSQDDIEAEFLPSAQSLYDLDDGGLYELYEQADRLDELLAEAHAIGDEQEWDELLFDLEKLEIRIRLAESALDIELDCG